MGTNFYLQPGCHVCGCTHERPPRVHIGKSSAGWMFTFHATDEIRSAAQWREALASGGVIVDEYGGTVTPEEFWAIVESKKTAAHHHALECSREDGSFVGPEGESMSPGEFS